MDVKRDFNGHSAGYGVMRPNSNVPELISAGDIWRTPNWKLLDVQHPVWKIRYQVEGDITIKMDGANYKLERGALLAVAPNVVHSLRGKDRQHCMYANIDFEKVFRRFPDFRNLWIQKKLILIPDAHEIEEPFSELIYEATHIMPFHEAGLRTALDYILIRITRLLGDTRFNNSFPISLLHESVDRAKLILDSDYSRSWTINELGEFAGLHPTHLAKLFSQQVGLSPHKYLINARLKCAKRMLKNSDLSITDIAYELGFSSSQIFSRCFKSQAKISPRQFRNDSQSPNVL